MEETQRLLPHTSSKDDSKTASLAHTVRALILCGQSAAAQKLRVSHGMDERHFYHVNIEALGLLRAWAALVDFASSKRPPVGFIPFVAVCQRYAAPMPVLNSFLEKAGDAAKNTQLLSFAKRSFSSFVSSVARDDASCQ